MELQYIAQESGVTKYPDPLGGSYVIEELTEKYVNESEKLIQRIDKLGGAIASIENGFINQQISSSAYDYQKDIESKKIPTKIIIDLLDV